MSNFGIEVYHCGKMKDQLTTGLLVVLYERNTPLTSINHEHLKNIA